MPQVSQSTHLDIRNSTAKSEYELHAEDFTNPHKTSLRNLVTLIDGGRADTIFTAHIDGGFANGEVKLVDCSLSSKTQVLPFYLKATFIKDDTSVNTVSFVPPEPGLTIMRQDTQDNFLTIQDEFVTFARAASNYYEVS